MADLALLEKECRLLCRQVFGVDPPAGCIESYQRAHAVVFAGQDAGFFSKAVLKGWDLEAMEFALRLKDKNNPLSKKINILFYVLEASPWGYKTFVNTQDSRLKGWKTLILETLRSAYKLAKGWLLLFLHA